ncbi:site-specific DNA-methyltransferase [Nocardioides glacieisoli]|uniref:Methyltransferase n=1 Tax=Nocardioides glacieisoli TaxID=1168730 RepID=A0A4Q2RL60_9ACTN|nr:site-specific DNA-methyltransferase [Nocardioides glacieisoli]RYB88265.1 site-specific DNA-methyltransferase [Nocardioides glacieisoli]
MSVLQRGQIIEGDALTVLQALPDQSIDTIVTSPPYFRLRDYGVNGQLGLEPHVDDWVMPLRDVLRECARVLVPTGTVWLNVGDSYSTHGREGAARKSLLLGPERLALALIGDGWIIRNKIIWAKTNTVPTSVRDRLATKHEVIYLLTRSAQYFFDLDDVRQPHVSRPPKPRAVTRPSMRPSWLGPNSDSDLGLAALHAAGLQGHPLGKNPGDVWSMSVSSYRGAHFATYPPKLIERILRAGCPERRCQTCRRPYVRPLKRRGASAHRLTLRPSCDCQARSEPGLVLDPFMGAGSTAVAAESLGRDWVGIELNPEFRRLALERIRSAHSP